MYRTRTISITSDGGQSNGYHFQATRIRRTSSSRSTDLHPSSNGRCSEIANIFEKSKCSDILIRLQRHKLPKSLSSMEDPVVFPGAKSVWSSFGRTVVGAVIRENSIAARLGNGY